MCPQVTTFLIESHIKSDWLKIPVFVQYEEIKITIGIMCRNAGNLQPRVGRHPAVKPDCLICVHGSQQIFHVDSPDILKRIPPFFPETDNERITTGKGFKRRAAFLADILLNGNRPIEYILPYFLMIEKSIAIYNEERIIRFRKKAIMAA